MARLIGQRSAEEQRAKIAKIVLRIEIFHAPAMMTILPRLSRGCKALIVRAFETFPHCILSVGIVTIFFYIYIITSFIIFKSGVN